MAIRTAGDPLRAGALIPAASAMGASRIAEGLVCAALTWGVFAFGAVYPWGYWPLAAVCAAAGVAALCQRRRAGLAAGTGRIAAAMAIVACAAVVQLLPIPLDVLARLSPARFAVLGQLDLRVAHGLVRSHSLSLDPASTWRALALYVCFALAALGVARCSTRGALRIAWCTSLVGIAVALTGIIQKPLYHGALYGFWVPMTHGTPFGPFVNKNHFAGWVAMTIPLALGCVCALVSRAHGTVRSNLGASFAWLSSQDANQALQSAFAAALMALGLGLTLSRSGMVSLAAAMVLCGVVGLRRYRAAAVRLLAVTSITVALLLAVSCAGVDTIVDRFDAADTSALGGRIPIWRGATHILADFWAMGSGLNTYGIATLVYPADIASQHVREAHNDYLQLAVEGGVLLCAPAAIAIVMFGYAVRRRFASSQGAAYWVRLGAVGGIVAVAVQSLVDFSLQMPGNAALFAVLCGIALHEEHCLSG